MQQGATSNTSALRYLAVRGSTGRPCTAVHWRGTFTHGRWRQAGSFVGGVGTATAVAASGKPGRAGETSLDQAIADEVAAVAASPAAEGILLYIDVPYCMPLSISLKAVMRFPHSTMAAAVLSAVKTNDKWAARRLAWCDLGLACLFKAGHCCCTLHLLQDGMREPATNAHYCSHLVPMPQ